MRTTCLQEDEEDSEDDEEMRFSVLKKKYKSSSGYFLVFSSLPRLPANRVVKPHCGRNREAGNV